MYLRALNNWILLYFGVLLLSWILLNAMETRLWGNENQLCILCISTIPPYRVHRYFCMYTLWQSSLIPWSVVNCALQLAVRVELLRSALSGHLLLNCECRGRARSLQDTSNARNLSPQKGNLLLSHLAHHLYIASKVFLFVAHFSNTISWVDVDSRLSLSGQHQSLVQHKRYYTPAHVITYTCYSLVSSPPP